MSHPERIFQTPRTDGRFLSTMGFCNHLMKTGRPKLGFDPSMSPKTFSSWQTNVQEKLHELMCFPTVPEQPAPKQLSSEPRNGYRLEKWEAYPEPGSVVPYLVLVPDGVTSTSPAPAVLCFPGSASSKELLAGEPELRPEQPENRHAVHNQMALWYVKQGLIAIAIENPGTAELDELPISGKYPNSGRDKLCGELLMLGRHYVGHSVFQKKHILQWARSLDIIDNNRIALSGHSLGTEPAMVLAVLEQDIQAFVFNDFFCTNRLRYATAAKPDESWRHNNPLWHIIPGLLDWFDFPDLLAAYAPRPLIITEGGAAAHLEQLNKAFEIAGAPQNYQYHYYPKFQNPADRKHDFEEFPEGLTQDEWFEYTNVDVPNHYFKEDVAVPWLVHQLQKETR
ncbi:MAG: hypothetical protein O2954_06950 [bacterium]|nr:hypothetical protein [bacterium]